MIIAIPFLLHFLPGDLFKPKVNRMSNPDVGLRVLVVLHGDIDRAFLASEFLRADQIVVADGAARVVLEAGGSCDVIVSDCDSLDERGLLDSRAANPEVDVRVFPSAKDVTDGELALRAALDMSPDSIVVVGAFGGCRLDHELANIFLLANADWCDHDIVLTDPRREVSLVTKNKDQVRISGSAGDFVTLLPVDGPAIGVRSIGLRYGLEGRDLDVGTSLGVSNELLGDLAILSVEDGRLLVVRERR